jgi:hypothetical protein
MCGTVFAYGMIWSDKAPAGKRIRKTMDMMIPWTARLVVIAEVLTIEPEELEPDVEPGGFDCFEKGSVESAPAAFVRSKVNKPLIVW